MRCREVCVSGRCERLTLPVRRRTRQRDRRFDTRRASAPGCRELAGRSPKGFVPNVAGTPSGRTTGLNRGDEHRLPLRRRREPERDVPLVGLHVPVEVVRVRVDEPVQVVAEPVVPGGISDDAADAGTVAVVGANDAEQLARLSEGRPSCSTLLVARAGSNWSSAHTRRHEGLAVGAAPPTRPPPPSPRGARRGIRAGRIRRHEQQVDFHLGVVNHLPLVHMVREKCVDDAVEARTTTDERPSGATRSS